MALRARLASIPLPILVSVFLHATAGASLIVVKGGHHRAVTTEVTVVDIETLPPDTVPVEEEEAIPDQPKANAAAPAPHDHTHPYPVPADHDAKPHDPSAQHHHDEPPAPAPAEPAPVVAQDAPAALPRFTIAIGNNAAPSHGPQVATDAHGSGHGSAAAQPPAVVANEVTLPASAVQVPAKLVTGSTAAYPAGARADETEGDVGLEIVVDGEGRVVDARVARSAGHGFDESALVAIKRYRFSPAQVSGRAVRVRMPWTVQFRLR